jgi:hypothetical protein
VSRETSGAILLLATAFLLSITFDRTYHLGYICGIIGGIALSILWRGSTNSDGNAENT